MIIHHHHDFMKNITCFDRLSLPHLTKKVYPGIWYLINKIGKKNVKDHLSFFNPEKNKFALNKPVTVIKRFWTQFRWGLWLQNRLVKVFVHWVWRKGGVTTVDIGKVKNVASILLPGMRNLHYPASDRNLKIWLAETNTICSDIMLPY